MDGQKKHGLFDSRIRKCPVCGKEFIVQDAVQWIYKKKGAFFDSWTCYQKGVKNDCG